MCNFTMRPCESTRKMSCSDRFTDRLLQCNHGALCTWLSIRSWDQPLWWIHFMHNNATDLEAQLQLLNGWMMAPSGVIHHGWWHFLLSFHLVTFVNRYILSVGRDYITSQELITLTTKQCTLVTMCVRTKKSARRSKQTPSTCRQVSAISMYYSTSYVPYT